MLTFASSISPLSSSGAFHRELVTVASDYVTAQRKPIGYGILRLTENT